MYETASLAYDVDLRRGVDINIVKICQKAGITGNQGLSFMVI